MVTAVHNRHLYGEFRSKSRVGIDARIPDRCSAEPSLARESTLLVNRVRVEVLTG